MLQFCEQLEDSFINADNARKMCNLADWTSYFAWDLLSEITWSGAMGFTKTGSDIKKMSPIGKFSVMYLRLCHGSQSSSASNPYRLKTVDAVVDTEKSGLGPKNGHIASFLEAQKAYPDVVTNDNIVMHILTNDRFLATTTLFKVAAMLFRRYNVGLDELGQEWELRRHWMVYNDKTRVRIARYSVPV
ncbi:putative pisatin demethylase [Diaporthe ampelina]|uniref:Putative pisatin demethylase n=1 Tax=Diaporthe ampelina TaxID=1214573 RepID=A0A0G2FWL9_9PEZI|nr:putative pisatin demethylase [Diaporthe ampelina]